jgi:hypothetical protein
MRFFFLAAVVGACVLSGSSKSRGQAPAGPSESWKSLITFETTGPTAEQNGAEPALDQKLAQLKQELADLEKKVHIAQQVNQPDVKQQIEILSKQIETQQKMIQLLLEQVKKQPPALEAQAKRAAQRDVELSQAIDNVVEHQDAQERYGPWLPSQIKALFLPSGNNETPLTISGALAVGYTNLQGTPQGFYFGEFSPDFFLKLNDWIFMESEIAVGPGGAVNATFAQADFIVNDWLTVIAGKFVAPIGWYNERMNNPWINKLPADAPGAAPLLWLQVLPAISLMGVQARGSFYLGNSPFKMEYSAYVSNGLNVTPAAPGAPTIDELANLEGMTGTESNALGTFAFGGRIGLWYPEAGLEVGLSGLINGPYVFGGFPDSISLFAVDFNYRKGNWDVRAEYGFTYQQAGSFLPNDIVRQGVFAQVAYRPYDAKTQFFRNLEFVYRFCYVDFSGIDPTTLNLAASPPIYGTPLDVPVRRFQHEVGINYYFYPRAVLKFGYQFNDEPGFELNDNHAMVEFAWGW